MGTARRYIVMAVVRKIFTAVILLSIVGAGFYAALALVDQFRPESDEESPPPVGPATEVRVVDVSTMEITKEVKGVCEAASRVDPREDAWRCVQGKNVIRDPCFAVSGERVVCPRRPWAAKAVAMDLRKPLPEDRGAAAEVEAWGIQLEGGARCSFVGGGTFTVDDTRANYDCDGVGFGVGLPDTSTERWTIGIVDGPDDDEVELVAIDVAWA